MKKTRRLVYGPFYLAINITFYESINVDQPVIYYLLKIQRLSVLKSVK